MSSHSFVLKMKCQVTSSTIHQVLISREIRYKNYKEICSGEKIKINFGYNNDPSFMTVENNTLIPFPQSCDDFTQRGNPWGNKCIHGTNPYMSEDWEVLSKFFSHHNIELNWLNCNMTWGWYDEELGGWTGCLGKV